MSRIFCITFLLIALFVKDSYAYLEPGTAGSIWQIVVSSLVAGAVTLKIYWHKFMSFFYNLFKKKQQNSETKDK